MALFDVRELIRMAVKDEETGIAFYKALAEATKAPNVESQMIAISKQEEVHRERFQKMLDELGGYQPSEQYTGQYDEYLRALLDSRAFPAQAQAAEQARAAKSDAEAVEIAMRLEKDALVFLNEVRNLVPDVEADKVNAVIQEERAHLTELTALRKTLA